MSRAATPTGAMETGSSSSRHRLYRASHCRAPGASNWFVVLAWIFEAKDYTPSHALLSSTLLRRRLAVIWTYRHSAHFYAGLVIGFYLIHL